ncbi:hypothetical protein M0804_003498 [Polistes exclamans]|nr:hypothetical protein M0804_003498 [Polistes exclamans]
MKSRLYQGKELKSRFLVGSLSSVERFSSWLRQESKPAEAAAAASSQPTRQLVSQPVSQSVNQPTNQPVSQPTNQPTSQPTMSFFHPHPHEIPIIHDETQIESPGLYRVEKSE